MTSHSVFIPHGGGPMPLLGDQNHQEMVDVLKQLAARLPRPKRIVVISAHWESECIAVTAQAKPPLLYDYYGFPEESYQLHYPCLGEPNTAEHIVNTLCAAGINSRLETMRGLDHGVFVPLLIMYPEANIPVLQISLHQNLDAHTHISVGKALARCNLEDTLFLGSGFSFHNMRAFFGHTPEVIQQANTDFEDWIKATLSTGLDASEIDKHLVAWQAAPGARLCQPREEHLLPLHVCFGIASKSADRYQRVTVINKQAALIEWELN